MASPSIRSSDLGHDPESRWKAVFARKSALQEKMMESISECDSNQDFVHSVQEDAYNTSLAIAQEEVDILKTELENALRALSGSKDAIQSLKEDLKSKETCLATVQLQNELLAFELNANSSSNQGMVPEATEVKTTTDKYGPSQKVSNKPCEFVDFAHFETNPQLVISPTESTSIMSNDESSILTPTMNTTAEERLVDLDSFDSNGESTIKSIFDQSPDSSSVPKSSKKCNLFGNTSNTTSISRSGESNDSSFNRSSSTRSTLGFYLNLKSPTSTNCELYDGTGRISPLTTICNSNAAENLTEGTNLCHKCSEIRIGFIEKDGYEM